MLDDSVIQYSLSQAIREKPIREKPPSLSAEAEFQIFADPEKLASGRTVYHSNPSTTLGLRGFTIASLDDVGEREIWTENGRSLRRMSDTLVCFAETWTILVHPLATEASKARRLLVGGQCPVSRPEAVTAAGLLCRIDRGEPPEPPPQIMVEDVLPLSFRSFVDIRQEVLQAWSLSSSDGLFEATARFLDFCKNLPYWSSTCFHVMVLRDSSEVESFLVVSEAGLSILSPLAELVVHFKLAALKNMKSVPALDGLYVVTLDFGAHHPEPVQLMTPEGPRVMESVKQSVHQCLVKQRIVGSDLPSSPTPAPVLSSSPLQKGHLMRHHSWGGSSNTVSSGGESSSPASCPSYPAGRLRHSSPGQEPKDEASCPSYPAGRVRHSSSGSSGESGSPVPEPRRRRSIAFSPSIESTSSGTSTFGRRLSIASAGSPNGSTSGTDTCLEEKALALANMRHRRPSLADSIGYYTG
eukprot:TRINITY_DN23314_c0_g1_i1.p1 TRINITY_DN23314_c0_g1~~TRINITY_DN23314_c0_g1_i1.p1  ORF type:complete len:468 (-),score=77.57 TRINITY_DN23314_c0_g1_i1:322-1725(-)